MITVAIVALVLGAVKIRQESLICRRRAAMHAWAEGMFRGRLANSAAFYPSDEQRQWATRRAAWHAQLRRKYERAASHPWESLDPDPPTP
jgi:hypothetical protein